MNNLPTELNMLLAKVLTCRELVRLSLVCMDWYHIIRVILLRRINCIHIKPFNLDNMKINSSVLIVGARGTGKSTLINDILFHHRESLTGGIYTGYDDSTTINDKLEKFYNKRIKDITSYQRESCYTYSKTLPVSLHYPQHNVTPTYHCVMDDFHRIPKLYKKIIINASQINVFVLLSTQYVETLVPFLRYQFRYFFIHRGWYFEDLYDKLNIDHIFSSSDVFVRYLQECVRNYGCLWEHTNKYGCLVIDMIDHNIFWYEADINVPKQIPDPIKEDNLFKYASDLDEVFNEND